MINIKNGDCLEVMKTIPDESIDLVYVNGGRGYGKTQYEKLQHNWDELKSWGEKKIENANKYLKDPNENWDEDARGYVLARKFQLEEMLKEMQELENSNNE